MARYAKGRHAKGRDARTGDKVNYRDMVSDGQYPNLRVTPGSRDIKHPVETPFRTTEAVILKNPAPDIDDDSGVGINDANVTLSSLYIQGVIFWEDTAETWSISTETWANIIKSNPFFGGET